ncbi:flagellar protein FliT [Parahaliea mediterranea]|uniref:Flagellar protein FliT n=1 Tax=Parahaliea mediterranea TaxID=651086 RepID=A0A939DD30_9GAMM|nr:flagellar protein FliT [Parahaliea mediterranea]MBN7795819.1 flagellar protein FliT [Parahaliea mediterranea]
MSAEDVLLVYESLLAATQSMLTLAREGDWSALLESESRYVVDVESLARIEAEVVLDKRQQARKAELLESILYNDVQIRKYLVARRDELGEKMGVSQRKRDLNRAYRPAGAVVTRLDDI